MMKQITENRESLVSLFKELGFNERQIRKLILLSRRYDDNIKILESCYLHYHDSMLSLGYDEDDIHELVSIFPKAMFQSFEDGNLEPFYEKYLSIMVSNSNLFDTKTKIDKTRRNLKILGLAEQRIEYILKTDLPICEIDPADVLDNIMFYLSKGMEEVELVEAVCKNATVLLYGRKEYAPLLELLDKIGFEPKDFKQMIILYIKRQTMVQPDVMYKTISWILSKNLDLQQVVKYLKSHVIRDLDEEDLERAYASLVDLGFSEKQANFAVSDNLGALYRPITKYEYIIEVGKLYSISKEKMIAILTGFSALSDLSEKKVVNKIKAITRYGLTDYIVNNPKNLIQSAELIDARASYLRLFYPRLDNDEFARDVFLDKKRFYNKYNRENNYLTEEMPRLKN